MMGDMHKDWFIRQVAEGDSALDAEVIHRLAQQLGVHFTEGDHFCVAVRYADTSRMISDALAPKELYNACSYAAKTRTGDLYCYIGSHLWTVVVAADTGANRKETVEWLYKSISGRVSDPIQIGVGRSYGDIEKLSYSKVEAYEALNSIDPHAQIFYVEDIYVTRSITTSKLEREKRKVVELFKAGKLDQMQVILEKLAENVRRESPVREGKPYPTSIRRTVVELVTELMHIGADSDVDVEQVLNYQDPYRRIFEADDTPDILSWFAKVSKDLWESISSQKSKTESSMLTRAKKCIDEHLSDPELSLSLVSDELGITSAYFSAFFIREEGTGFNDYITGLRVEKALHMLESTNMKINLIAAECGFRSPGYFISVFKKRLGMSPGEYRNRK